MINRIVGRAFALQPTRDRSGSTGGIQDGPPAGQERLQSAEKKVTSERYRCGSKIRTNKQTS